MQFISCGQRKYRQFYAPFPCCVAADLLILRFVLKIYGVSEIRYVSKRRLGSAPSTFRRQ